MTRRVSPAPGRCGHLGKAPGARCAPGWSGMVGSCTYRVASLEPGSRGVAQNVVISVSAVMSVEMGRHKKDCHVRSTVWDTAEVTRSPGCQITFSTRLIS